VAEFVQMMKDWQRMCDSMQGGIRKCDNCPLFNVLCQYKPNDKADFAKAEQIIEKWVEDNPEPVYPKWAEWLNSIGVTISDRPFPAPNIPVYVFQVNAKMFEPIPADIAQKLGIEPKEG
jgi:hypothetical protein